MSSDSESSSRDSEDCSELPRLNESNPVKVAPSTPAFVKLENFDTNVKCSLCLSNENDSIAYGEICKIEDIVCHYYCLLFSSSLVQNGADDEGILGFMPSDIKKERSRGGRLRCSYCTKKGATIGCNVKSCRKTFHLPCGLKNGSLHQYYDRFLSFCSLHRPHQKVNSAILIQAGEEEDSMRCEICHDNVDERISNDTLWAPCCKKRSFHRYCLQRQALSQGYFFRCPLCNDKEKFVQEMKTFGIFVPERDAAWEHDPRAYQELLHIHRTCNADECKCPSGRTLSQNTGSWRLLRCNACGSQGTHIICSGLKIAAASNSWRCPQCISILAKATPIQSHSDTSQSESSYHPPTSIAVASSTIASSSRPSVRGRSSSATTGPKPPRKRRKSSPNSVKIDPAVQAENLTLNPTSNVAYLDKSGPSKCKETKNLEDAIIIVDDSESDIEIVDEVTINQESQSQCPPAIESSGTELLTNEGKKIKVHKVTEEYGLSMGVGEVGGIKQKYVKEDPRSDTGIKAGTQPLDKWQKSLEGHCSVTIHPSPSTIIKPHVETEAPPKAVDTSSQKLPQTSNADLKMVNSASDNLQIRKDEVRRPSELIIPPGREGCSSFPAMFPFAGPGLFPYVFPQQPIFYVPVRTVDGQDAVQAMVPLSQLVQNQPANRERNQSSPDIITLD